CMSVDDMSCFSYQVAAGSTISETKVVEVLRKSVVSIKSSFPWGASSCHLIDCGRWFSGSSSAVASESTPSRWRKKNSVPFAEEPMRLVRQLSKIRGQFSFAEGSSYAKPSCPDSSCCGM